MSIVWILVMNSELPESSLSEQRTGFKDTLQLLTPSNEKSGVSMLGAGLAAGYVGSILEGPKLTTANRKPHCISVSDIGRIDPDVKSAKPTWTSVPSYGNPINGRK